MYVTIRISLLVEGRCSTIRGSGQYGVSTGKVQYEGREGSVRFEVKIRIRSGGQQVWIRYFLLSVGRGNRSNQQKPHESATIHLKP
jgi:hypothetical protein